jgi:hypothetical protein
VLAERGINFQNILWGPIIYLGYWNMLIWYCIELPMHDISGSYVFSMFYTHDISVSYDEHIVILFGVGLNISIRGAYICLLDCLTNSLFCVFAGPLGVQILRSRNLLRISLEIVLVVEYYLLVRS